MSKNRSSSGGAGTTHHNEATASTEERTVDQIRQYEKNDENFKQWCKEEEDADRFRSDAAFYRALACRCSREMILRVASNWVWYDRSGQPAAVPYVKALQNVCRDGWLEHFTRDEILALLEKKCFGEWTGHNLPSPKDHRQAARHDPTVITLFGSSTEYHAFLCRLIEADEAEWPYSDPEDPQEEDQRESEDYEDVIE